MMQEKIKRTWNLDCLEHLGALAETDDFAFAAARSRESECAMTRRFFSGVRIDGGCYDRAEIDRSRFENCSLFACDLSHCTFIEVEFDECDFSNCDFSEGYFKKCRFTRCKGVGARYAHAAFSMVEVVDSRFSDALFDECRFTDVRFVRADCTRASFSQTQLERFCPSECRFVENDFFKTKLAGIDFSDGELVAPIVSKPPIELAGASVNIFQAAGLASLLGLNVKE
jgi:uncharacterized protein YjbI with pentapeptide repeats